MYKLRPMFTVFDDKYKEEAALRKDKVIEMNFTEALHSSVNPIRTKIDQC